MDSEIRLLSLFDQACNDTLDDRAARELAQCLRESPAARISYLERCRLDGELFFLTRIEHSDAGLHQLIDQDFEDSQVDVESRWRRAWEGLYDVVSHHIALSLVIAALVITIIVLSLELIVVDRSPLGTPSPVFVAEVTGIRDLAEADQTTAILKSRALLPGDVLSFESGLVEVTYHNGTRIVLAGPVEYVVEGSNAGSLQSGKLVARVPQAAVGFTVTSPSATVIDLGTEFGMLVEPSGETQTHVLAGSVEVYCGPPGDKPSGGGRVLSAGEAVRIEGGKIIAIPRDVADAEKFVRSLPSRGATELPELKPALQFRPQFAGELRSDAKYTVGVLIEVGTQPLSVTHLGAQDVPTPGVATGLKSDGFHQAPVSVGLWNADGSRLLATARVGNSDRLVVNSWRYVRLEEPVKLEAGQRYLLGAYVGASIEWFYDGGHAADDEQPFVAGDQVAIVGNYFCSDSFGPPTSDGQMAIGRWAPANMLVTLPPPIQSPETGPTTANAPRENDE